MPDLGNVKRGNIEWGTASGTLDRGTFDPSTITLEELAQRVAALIVDLQTVGVLRTAVAPVNTVLPVISGTAEVGQTLSCTSGTWTGTATISYAYQWKRDGANISAATSSTYTIVQDDEGYALTCTVTASNVAGSTSATSDPTSTVPDTFNAFSDAFGRSDGAIGNGWTGSTWAIASGKAINTPVTFSAEKLADPGLEANYTAGQCDSWAAKAGSPTLAQSADVHGGSKAQEFRSAAANDHLRMLGTPSTATVGKWYQASEYAKRLSGSYSSVQFQLRSTNWNHVGVPVTGAAYTQLVTQAMCMTINSLSMYGVFETFYASGDAVVVDDLSLKEMTTTELFCTQQFGSSDNITIQVAATIPVGVIAGLVLDLDDPANPQNYVLVTVQRSLWFQAYKFVAGVPTLLVTTNLYTPYADGRIIKVVKTGTTYQFYYNNVQQGTNQTISDAGIVGNEYHGMFATHPTVLLDDFSIA